MKALLDTGVLLDLFIDRGSLDTPATRIKAMGFFNDTEIWASSKSLADVFFVLQGHMSSEALKQLSVNCRTYLYLCSITEENVFEAANRSWDDFESCLVNIAAEKLKVDVIITNDVSKYERSHVPVLTPKTFVVKMEEEAGLCYDELFA